MVVVRRVGRRAPSGSDDHGAWVAELTGRLLGKLATSPARTRLICRAVRRAQGAQLGFGQTDGFRYEVFLTDRDGDVRDLDVFHRQHARVEDRIRDAKDLCLRNLPFQDFANNGGLAAALPARPRPPRVEPATAADRRPRPCRTQDAALPPLAHRRQDRPSRQEDAPAAGPPLALGRPAEHLVRAAAGTPRAARRLTAPARHLTTSIRPDSAGVSLAKCRAARPTTPLRDDPPRLTHPGP